MNTVVKYIKQTYSKRGMQAIIIFLLVNVISLYPAFAQDNVETEIDVSPLEGPYLGQKTPGLIPEAFAPGVVTTEHYEFSCGTFTPDMKEFYLLRKGGKYENYSLVVFKQLNNRWYESIASPSIGRPSISPDGHILYLGKKYLERTNDGWSKVKKLGPYFEEIKVMRLTASAKGTFVLDEAGTDGDGIIRYSRIVDGEHEEPRPFGKEINSGTWNAHPFIAPDESYILWDGRREDGYGDSDIYISFKQKGGSWGAAINLGDQINTDVWEASASVTPDGKYLFFHRLNDQGKPDIYWVDAQVIERLRPK